MKQRETPQFTNSCGKLFSDKILLSSSGREYEVQVNNIRSISFKVRPQNKSLFFIGLPFILFAIPFVTGEKDGFIKLLFIGIGIALFAISILKMGKRYSVSVTLKQGSAISIPVWEGNRREAQKFTDFVKAKIAHRA